MQKRAISKTRRPRKERLDGELEGILRAIEKEDVPERLLELALQLQAALVARPEATAEAEE